MREGDGGGAEGSRRGPSPSVGTVAANWLKVMSVALSSLLSVLIAQLAATLGQRQAAHAI